ncbi:PiggyBac transposable element-derived protein like [Argiope bruennichi]|uniref:PiggyBac transposable element-derived protein like n=1 Tax=Argiope bruennichi TaxID=94029 RepID=A0A8T0FXU3_ARGBR|nr:PiggyBac transposable element-derived protein like [Argiope bruennichi]
MTNSGDDDTDDFEYMEVSESDTRKCTILSHKYKNMAMSSQIVLSLAEPLLFQGYCITTDNFYTSPELAEYLIQYKIDIYGTMRVDKKKRSKGITNSKAEEGRYHCIPERQSNDNDNEMA